MCTKFNARHVRDRATQGYVQLQLVATSFSQRPHSRKGATTFQKTGSLHRMISQHAQNC